jgi:hypothetical protein
LLLVSRNRTMGRGEPLLAVSNSAVWSRCVLQYFDQGCFLSRLHDQKYGLEKLAITYSLPKALLIWGWVFRVMSRCLGSTMLAWSSSSRRSPSIGGVLVIYLPGLLLAVWYWSYS